MSVKTELLKNGNNSIWERECEICSKDMMKLREGDIIFGSKWYHKGCWDLTDKERKLCHSHVNDVLDKVENFIDNNFIQSASVNDRTPYPSSLVEDTISAEATTSSRSKKER